MINEKSVILKLSGRSPASTGATGVEAEAAAVKPEVAEASTLIELYDGIVSRLPDRNCRMVQLVAAQAREGTSVLVRELARDVAVSLGKRVLILDSDQKRPGQAGFFQLGPMAGLQETCEKGSPIHDALRQVGRSSLYLGQLSNNGKSRATFDSPRVGVHLQELRKQYDLILVDTPSPQTCPEGLLLSRHVDGVVLVVEAGKTRWQVVERMRDRIVRQGGAILGVVLNRRRFAIPQVIYGRL